MRLGVLAGTTAGTDGCWLSCVPAGEFGTRLLLVAAAECPHVIASVLIVDDAELVARREAALSLCEVLLQVTVDRQVLAQGMCGEGGVRLP